MGQQADRRYNVNTGSDLLPLRSWDGIRTLPRDQRVRRLTEREFVSLLDDPDYQRDIWLEDLR